LLRLLFAPQAVGQLFQADTGAESGIELRATLVGAVNGNCDPKSGYSKINGAEDCSLVT
jgi:hypothetical protein